VCVCVFVCPQAYLPNHTRHLYQFFVHLAYRRGSASSGRGRGVTQSQGELAILGVFFPIDSALYNIAFGTHTKTAEPIDMPFCMKTRMGPRNHGGADPSGEGMIFVGCPGCSKVSALFAATVAAASLQMRSFNRQ